MARYGKESKLTPDKVLQKASGFFGPGGLGLEAESAAEGCVTFVGGGGYVSISACAAERGAEVEIETREWDIQVREFLGQI